MQGTIGVLTTSKAHHDQLLAQVDGLSVGTVAPHVHSVVSMGDRDLTRGRLPLGTDRWTTIVRPVETDRRALPVAAARNLAAANAVEAGADVLVFLDDTVIPGPHTLERLLAAVTGQDAAEEPVRAPVVWRAPVLDLPPLAQDELVYPLGRLAEIALPVGGTPSLVPGQLEVDDRWSLFDGACFAMSAEDFDRTGGFCTDYTGRGLQDADFAEVVRRAGGSLVWVGGADAYRQPGEPVDQEHQARHAVRHAQVWRQRWDDPPQHPWLARLQAEGLVKATDLEERVGSV
ncbi:glycosyltransferase family 2 protein [Ornithinimicrobium flavum]|uniref:glycosyltransferase family 2 protein n=1 Tax=Ornithinimicrobium flavum TaxID=1288636 RepID=UPI0010706437|nr:hypothetical protein [Ornithinimicrobium flavum]